MMKTRVAGVRKRGVNIRLGYTVAFLFSRVLAHFGKWTNTSVIDINGVQNTEKTKTIIYVITLAGAYVQAVRGTNTGEVFIPNNATNPRFYQGAYWGLNGPTRVYVINGPAGLGVEILPGADSLHWLIRLFNPTTGAELAAGNYAALNTGDLDFKIAAEGRAID